MRKQILTAVIIGSFALAGCEGMSPQEQMVVGGLLGASAGIITADAFNANRNWTVVAALSGAALGALVARNAATNECAYKVGPDRYEVRPCPR